MSYIRPIGRGLGDTSAETEGRLVTWSTCISMCYEYALSAVADSMVEQLAQYEEDVKNRTDLSIAGDKV